MSVGCSCGIVFSNLVFQGLLLYNRNGGLTFSGLYRSESRGDSRKITKTFTKYSLRGYLDRK